MTVGNLATFAIMFALLWLFIFLYINERIERTQIEAKYKDLSKEFSKYRWYRSTGISFADDRYADSYEHNAENPRSPVLKRRKRWNE